VKKLVNIFISLLLLTATFGVSVSKHYCMGRLQDQWIGQNHQEVCEGMESIPGMEGCCSNETETFKIDEDFSISSFDFNVNPEFSFLHKVYEMEILEATSSSFSINRPQNTGPPFVEPDIFLQVQSFLL